jgi:glycerol uptake facilitator-like aquaporin
MKGWWVYVAAPLVGAPVGAWIADKILYPNK